MSGTDRFVTLRNDYPLSEHVQRGLPAITAAWMRAIEQRN